MLAGLVNGVAGVILHLRRPCRWAPAAIIAVTSVLGAQLGARYGRRLPPNALRALIVVVGIAAIVQLLDRAAAIRRQSQESCSMKV